MPPTDPRYLALTDEQIYYDLTFIDLEREAAKKESGDGNTYEDDEYEQYDEETEEIDRRITYSNTPTKKTSEGVENNQQYDEDEWEDVEIDDFDSDEE